MDRKKTNPALLRFAFAMLAAALPPAVLAQAPPSADTFSFSTTPNKNYGSWPVLVVQHGATSYLQFDLSGFPAGVTVNKAMLRLYVDTVDDNGGSFDVYQLNSAWTEKSLTTANAPNLGPSATGSQPIAITTANLNHFVLVDITALVQSWISGAATNNGLALALTSGNGSFGFDSKESTFRAMSPNCWSFSMDPPVLRDRQDRLGSTVRLDQADHQGRQAPPAPPGTNCLRRL